MTEYAFQVSDLIILFIMIYTPIVIPKAWIMWFAAVGWAYLIGRHSWPHTKPDKP